jgi:hypothetical protein
MRTATLALSWQTLPVHARRLQQVENPRLPQDFGRSSKTPPATFVGLSLLLHTRQNVLIVTAQHRFDIQETELLEKSSPDHGEDDGSNHEVRKLQEHVVYQLMSLRGFLNHRSNPAQSGFDNQPVINFGQTRKTSGLADQKPDDSCAPRLDEFTNERNDDAICISLQCLRWERPERGRVHIGADLLLHNRGEERLLVFEIEIDRALRNSCSACDVFYARSGEAFLEKLLIRSRALTVRD